MLEFFSSAVAFLNDQILGYILIVALIGCGLYFTVATHWVQFVRPSKMFRLMLGTDSLIQRGNISPFQAFSISTASRVGTGNIAGVALAITVGGPGAIFWMWLIAVIGAASAFAESTLAQIYKVRLGNTFHGGPAFYIRTALKQRKLAIVFSVLFIITFAFVFNTVQANTIAQSLQTTLRINPFFTGLFLAAVAAPIIFGGLRRIAKFSAVIVPIFALAYIAVTIVIMLLHITELPRVLMLICSDAFSWHKFLAGALGATIMTGARRGLFSNEAGMGSAPNAAATAHTSHPVKQGYVQAFGVFVDTLLICSCTAFIVLLADYTKFPGLEGIALTQAVLTAQLGSFGNYFISASVLLFAFTSIIGNYYYGQANIEFLAHRRWIIAGFRIAVCFAIWAGALLQLKLVWGLADLFMTIIALINIYAILRLRKQVVGALDDYRSQVAQGKNPVYKGPGVWE